MFKSIAIVVGVRVSRYPGISPIRLILSIWNIKSDRKALTSLYNCIPAYLNTRRRDLGGLFEKPVQPWILAEGHIEAESGAGPEIRAEDITGREHDAFLDGTTCERRGIPVLLQTRPDEHASLRFVEEGQAARL
jgi:hypothetical protein